MRIRVPGSVIVAATLCGLLLGLSASAFAATDQTTLTWSRVATDGPVKVETEHPGPALKRAQRDVEKLALYLDAIRTLRPHVMWRSIRWRRGVIEVRAGAETAIYGNMAILVARNLFQGYGSAGSGVQQLRLPDKAAWKWNVRMLLAPPMSRLTKPEKP
ncbi:MAG: hypothetical protein VYE15_02895 [Myxococcota bacterium]|nr:hypothetical protein [Myxococcota bacterium]